VLLWQERGGPEVSPPERRSFGTRLIEDGIAYEFGGEVNLEFLPPGVRCELRFPLALAGDPPGHPLTWRCGSPGDLQPGPGGYWSRPTSR
jgi:hypothetical protein